VLVLQGISPSRSFRIDTARSDHFSAGARVSCAQLNSPPSEKGHVQSVNSFNGILDDDALEHIGGRPRPAIVHISGGRS